MSEEKNRSRLKGCREKRKEITTRNKKNCIMKVYNTTWSKSSKWNNYNNTNEPNKYDVILILCGLENTTQNIQWVWIQNATTTIWIEFIIQQKHTQTQTHWLNINTNNTNQPIQSVYFEFVLCFCAYNSSANTKYTICIIYSN